VKTTVTVLRAGRTATSGDGSGVPQARQKLALVGLVSPHAGQMVMPSRYRLRGRPPRFRSASLRLSADSRGWLART
jgi:hypothetical protein